MNIFPCFQSQISNANEIMKKQSVEDIPSAVKGELVYIDAKFMQHNDIIKICGHSKVKLFKSVKSILTKKNVHHFDP